MEAIRLFYKEYKSSLFVQKFGHLISYQSMGFVTLFGAFTVGTTWDKIISGSYAAIGLTGIHILYFLGNILFRYNPDRESRTHGKLIVELGDRFSLIHEVRKQYLELDLEKERLNGLTDEKQKQERYKELILRKNQADDGAKFALKSICDTLATHFSEKSKSTCCVSIKIIADLDYTTYRDAIVYNDSRDNKHVSKRDTKVYKDQRHTIEGNTSFSMVAECVDDINENEYAFIHGSINDDPYYKNTSKAVYDGAPLPYNSELVVPLVPSKGTNPTLIGFLCVDSDRKNRFGKVYDIPVMRGVADGIYDVIMNKRLKIRNYEK